MMTQKTGFLQLSIYLCFLILLASCGESPEIPKQPDIDRLPTPGAISEPLTARIYFDATVSMKGFVVPGATDYTRMLPHLESSVLTGWTNGKAEFFRFGTQVEPINRTTYLKVAHPEFYNDATINKKTLIQEVINDETQEINNRDEVNHDHDEANIERDEANNNHDKANSLAVIVTDLFQDEGDINRLVAQLKEKYLQKELAVGLLGIRSQFDGTVYDAGINVPPIDHQGDRPFYLLVLGRHANIAHYFDQLIASGFPEAKTVLCSQYLVDSLVASEGASVSSIENLVRIESLVRPPDVRLKQFRIRKKRDPAKFSAKLKYIRLSHTMSFEPDQLEISVIAKHAPAGQTLESPTAQACLNVTPTLVENELTLDVRLTPRDLPKGIYFYEGTLGPKIDGYRIPAWCSAWDMGLERDGSKTLNLGSFVRDLSHVAAQMHQPKIAKFYFYIEKK
jgi:hypothetical protein